jgi:hypothetical protein
MSPTEKIDFEKHLGDDTLRCHVEVFADGSVYAWGDDVERVFERGSDLPAAAIAHVESLGYTRRP